jgi:hypothetical protein
MMTANNLDRPTLQAEMTGASFRAVFVGKTFFLFDGAGVTIAG